MQPLTFGELHALPTVVDLMTAARALGIGRSKAYQLAHDGQFPCRIIRIGTHYNIPTADLLRLLGVTPVAPPGTTAGDSKDCDIEELPGNSQFARRCN
jgi:excisionase family DNA binding protein